FKPLPSASLSRALDILDVHLESGEIMARWGTPTPLRWLLQSHRDTTEQRAWATRMVRRSGSRGVEVKTQEDWGYLLMDTLKLTETEETGLKGAFGLLSRNE